MIDIAKVVYSFTNENYINLSGQNLPFEEDVLATYPDSGITTITYIYKEKADLIVKHLFFEEDGTTPSTQPTQTEPAQNGFVGDPYITNALTTVPAGYILLPFANSGNTAGNYVSGTTTVNYSYKIIPLPLVTLEVNHIFLDDKGNVTTNPPTTTKSYTDKQGSAYATTSLTTADIPSGYRLAKPKLPVNGSGSYLATLTVVNYYYEPIPIVQPRQGTVTVVHTIEHSDGTVTVVEEETPIIDDIADPYTSNPINIPRYVLKIVPSNASGTITSTPQKVSYLYVADPTKAQLIEKHLLLDSAGKVVGEVAAPKVTIGLDGTAYTTLPKPPLEYELVSGKVPNNASGKYTTGIEQVVTYYYAPIGSTGGGGGTGGNTGGGAGGNSWSGTSTGSSNKPSTSSEQNDPLNPQTGDQGVEQTVLYLLYAVLSAALLLFAYVMTTFGKKKRSKRKRR